MRTEGDEWYRRNREYDPKSFLEEDPICKCLEDVSITINGIANVLEVGSSDGRRLKALKEKYNWNYKGVDPSKTAIEKGATNHIQLFEGSADKLPIESSSIDILIYGFCLYLCDREELFLISAEANRVSKNESWIIIHDFWANHDKSNEYHHKEGIRSYKTRPEEMFTWHESFTLMEEKIRNIDDGKYTDDQDKWVKTSVLRKITKN